MAQKNWYQTTTMYSLYVDAWAGDLKTLTDRLDYFTDLGIDSLHILPLFESPGCDDGYDVTDHTQIQPALGTIDDFKRLCTEAHKRDIKIIVDLILNHVSEEHVWFQEARSSKDNPKRDWFLWSDTGTEFAEAPNIFPDFKPSNWIKNPATDDFYYATFKPCQPDLNWSNKDVMAAMFAVADTLISYGADGFRLDAVMNLVEKDGTTSVGIKETHERIAELRSHLETHHPDSILLGEIVGTTGYSKSYFGTSRVPECHLSYNFELMNELLQALVLGERPDRLRVVLEAIKNIPPTAGWLTFLRNHDSLTFVSADTALQKEFLQTVDPDGHFAFSHGKETVQRLASLLQTEDKLRLAFEMLYALPTATVMYYGDEIGMKNAAVPPGTTDMRLVVRASFDWEEAERQRSDPHSLFSFVRTQISKRKNNLS